MCTFHISDASWPQHDYLQSPTPALCHRHRPLLRMTWHAGCDGCHAGVTQASRRDANAISPFLRVLPKPLRDARAFRPIMHLRPTPSITKSAEYRHCPGKRPREPVGRKCISPYSACASRSRATATAIPIRPTRIEHIDARPSTYRNRRNPHSLRNPIRRPSPTPCRPSRRARPHRGVPATVLSVSRGGFGPSRRSYMTCRRHKCHCVHPYIRSHSSTRHSRHAPPREHAHVPGDGQGEQSAGDEHPGNRDHVGERREDQHAQRHAE